MLTTGLVAGVVAVVLIPGERLLRHLAAAVAGHRLRLLLLFLWLRLCGLFRLLWFGGLHQRLCLALLLNLRRRLAWFVVRLFVGGQLEASLLFRLYRAAGLARLVRLAVLA